MEFRINKNLNIINNPDKLNPQTLFKKFFNDPQHIVYIFKNNSLDSVITHNSFINSNFDIKKSLIKIQALTPEELQDERIILEKCKINNYYTIPILKDNNLLGEVKLLSHTSIFSMDKKRWTILYNFDQGFARYLEKLNFKKIGITGTYSKIIYNYLKKYGNFNSIEIVKNDLNSFEDSISKLDFLLETNSAVYQMKNYYLNLKKCTNNIKIIYKDIYELCNDLEVENFINSDLVKKTSFFEFPQNDELINLTLDEKIRISIDKHYRFYYDNMDNMYINNLVKNVFGDMFSEEFIDSRNYLSQVKFNNGLYSLIDSKNSYCRAVNGVRYTTDKTSYYKNCIYVFGGCTVYGATVDDKNTIPSNLQRLINSNYKDYEVINMGTRNLSVFECIRKTNRLKLNPSDKLVFISLKEELESVLKFGNIYTYKLKDKFNSDKSLTNYFLDEPLHCNHIAMKKISEFIFENIKDQLENKQAKNNVTPAKKEPINEFQKTSLLENPEVIEYFSFLKKYKTNHNYCGIVQLHGNPFTLGHLKLIQYATNRCDHLFVFVAGESSSIFTSDDRFKMAKLACKDMQNVTIVKEKMNFSGQVVLPGYFDRDNNPDAKVDIKFLTEMLIKVIAPILNIKVKFVGTEPFDVATAKAIEEIVAQYPKMGMKVELIPRFENEKGIIISAKTVRNALKRGDWETIQQMVPKTTEKILHKYENLI